MLFSDVDRVGYRELLLNRLGPLNEFSPFCRPIDWDRVEADFGVELPVSFKHLSCNLPAGFLGSGITWTSPGSGVPGFGFDRDTSWNYSNLMRESGTLPLYPQSPGYLVFASTSLRIDMAYWVEPMSTGTKRCQSSVCLVECVSGEMEPTNVEIDEFLYRAITNKPQLEGPLSGQFHEWFFSDSSFPLFRPASSLNL